jgi:predicted ATPase
VGLDEERSRYRSVDDLGADFSLPLHHKAELLHELFPEAFAEIQASFQDAFPLVEELSVPRFVPWGIEPAEAKAYQLSIAAKETGVPNLVLFQDMSSGMQRHLSFLVHLSFAPRGTVVLIDELESSLGVNCLPAATRFLQDRQTGLQFIITSHHPYIIEQIKTSCWKIVTRRGSRVRVLEAAQIPALAEGRSHLDRFTRLMNLPEYEHGIQA